MPWIIAVLPVAMLAISLALGWWAHGITLLAHVVVMLLAIAIDVRLLLRAGSAMSFLPAWYGPGFYLYRRSWRTGREWGAAVVGILATLLWVGALVFAFINFIDESERRNNERYLNSILAPRP